MSAYSLRRTLLASSCVAAPLFGLVAAVATPALKSTRGAEIGAISAAPGRFYVYAVFMLFSSYLLVPAVFGLLGLVKVQRPGWALTAGVLAQAGLLVAIGDAAVELLYWQMGQPGADHQQMAALADRYENASGAALVYSLGGLAMLIGIVLLAVLLWRTRAIPRLAAAALAVGAVTNVFGFAAASRPILIGSYVVLGACLIPAAAAILQRQDEIIVPPAERSVSEDQRVRGGV
jgi:hypothetical protein